MAFGGLGVMMFSGPPALWSINMALRKVDLQSLFFASMFVVILVILGEHIYHLLFGLWCLILVYCYLISFHVRAYNFSFYFT